MSSRIVWISWKDTRHPQAGGAELVQHELCKRLAADGHQVTVIAGLGAGTSATQTIDGYKVLRAGSRYTVHMQAVKTYWQNMRGKTDIIIEEVNTAPFFAKFYPGKAKHIMLFHQLAREIWFYEFFKPLAFIGYLAEPIYLRLARSKNVIAMSPSTKADLRKHGYKKSNISIISEGITLPCVSTAKNVKKYNHPSLLAYGSIRAMKRTMHIVKAFEQAATTMPQLTLTIAGDDSGKYAAKVKKYIANSKYASRITVLGRLKASKRAKVLGKHHFVVAAALKEGWGLTITEAAAQGTPAIAYNVDGQRDAVEIGKTGVLCEPDVTSLAGSIMQAFDTEVTDYPALQAAALAKAKTITFDQAYKDFLEVI